MNNTQETIDIILELKTNYSFILFFLSIITRAYLTENIFIDKIIKRNL